MELVVYVSVCTPLEQCHGDDLMEGEHGGTRMIAAAHKLTRTIAAAHKLTRMIATASHGYTDHTDAQITRIYRSHGHTDHTDTQITRIHRSHEYKDAQITRTHRSHGYTDHGYTDHTDTQITRIATASHGYTDQVGHGGGALTPWAMVWIDPSLAPAKLRGPTNTTTAQPMK